MDGVQLSFVNDLTPARDFWHMKAKIIKLWKQSYRWDMILLDELGQKIQACVKINLVSDFASQLNEDVVLLLRKFGVGQQKDKHLVIPLNHTINFFKCTSVQHVSGFQGHPYGFYFRSFLDIVNNNLGPALTVDVIGRLAWCGDLDIFKSGATEHKRLLFDLQDYEGDVLRCTFWAGYAEELNAFISSNTSTEMVILVIQHGRVKFFKGVWTVQNDMFATRVFINEDLEEANELRKRLILKDGPDTSLTVLSSQTVYPLRNDFVVRTVRKHVDEIIEIDQEMTCVVVATIMMLEEDNGWFYIACRTCDKKALTKTEYLESAVEIPSNFIDAPVDSLWCIKCKGIATSLVPKFKVQFRVQDGTGSVSFVMFDSDVSKILGLSANDIRERQIKSGDLESFPHELTTLQDKLFAFKVHISTYNLQKKYNVYTVRKICADQEVIDELLGDDQGDEGQAEGVVVKLDDSIHQTLSSKDALSCTGDSLAVDLSKDSATSPPSKRITPVCVDECSEDQGSTTRCVKKKLQA